MNKTKIIVILGQTSTGKSDFAVEIARQINGEIISADSRQVYKGMNIGTGKITKKEMLGITHHLLDVVSPKKTFSVSDFQKMTFKKIENIIKDNKTPILCGGTGFYIDSIVNGTIFPEVPPNNKLREILNKKTLNQLFKILEKIDKNRAKNIDKNNKIRIIRAIEIAKTLGFVPKVKIIEKFDVFKIGLSIPDEILKEKIKFRIVSRIKKGMIKEIQNLHDNGLSWKKMEAFGLEYKFISLYLQNKITINEMIEQLNTATWHYAKRQKTWFKRDTNTIWINPLKQSEKQKIIKEIRKFLK